jgi:phospholipase/lecithinase/hemolysin
LTAVLVLLATFPVSSALALDAYDDFESYTSGASVNGLSGGTGWTSNWTGATGTSISDETIHYLHDTVILGGGNSLKIAGNAESILSRTLPSGTTGADYFAGFVFQIKGGTPGTNVSGNIFTGWQAQDAAPNSANDSIGFLGSGGKAGARVANSSDTVTPTLKYGQTYLFVIKYGGWNGSNYTTTRVWLNPTVNDEASSNAAVTISKTVSTAGAGSSGFTGLRVRSVGLDATTYYLVDDLRVGSSWSDVVSPPPGYTGPPVADPFRELVVFGDSLSSGGQGGTPSTGPAPTSTNGGYLRQTWIQQLSPWMGTGPLVNYYVPGGTNYAVGGDTTVEMVDQVDRYLIDVLGGSNPGGLYVLWCGGNDIGDSVKAVSEGGTIFTIISKLANLNSAATAAANAAVDRMEAQIRRLSATGATEFVWVNMPDLSKTPSVDYYVDTYAFGLSSVRTTVANALHNASVAFNTRMNARMAVLHTDLPAITIQKIDAYAAFNDIIANKATYGFTNVTDSSSTDNSYLFYDRVHPTSHGHYEIAQIAQDAIYYVLDGSSFATGTRKSLSNFGWAGWGAEGSSSVATTYTSVTLGSDGSIPRLGVHYVNGAGAEPGVLFAHTGSSSTAANRNDRFVVSSAIDPLTIVPGRRLSLVWDQSFNNTVSTTRVLVQVSGNWYASASTFGVSTAGGSGSMTNEVTGSLDLAGPNGLGTTQWYPVTFGNGQAISLSGSLVPSAIGTTATGIGFLTVTGSAPNRVVFIDDVELIAGENP